VGNLMIVNNKNITIFKNNFFYILVNQFLETFQSGTCNFGFSPHQVFVKNELKLFVSEINDRHQPFVVLFFVFLERQIRLDIKLGAHQLVHQSDIYIS